MDSFYHFFDELTIHDGVGLLGVCVLMGAYVRVQWQRDFAKTTVYSILNFWGSVFLVWAACWKWNPAAFIGNAAWAVISLYGVYRCLKYRKRDRERA